ncbi:hypothetical protein BC938DRAFT_479884, partial [Jimgerdemannia flammicorona]
EGSTIQGEPRTGVRDEETDGEDDLFEEERPIAPTEHSTSSTTTTPDFDMNLIPLTQHPIPPLPLPTAPPPSPALHRQSSLHAFLNLPSHLPPTYFVLAWPAGADAYPCARFTDTKPSDARFRAVFQWRDVGKDVVLCSNLAGDEATAWRGGTGKYMNVPLLKSHLQKCARRQRGELAMRTAWEMMKIGGSGKGGGDRGKVDGMGELLRRLPIVIVEDVTLHAALPILVWLMAAHAKGFHLPLECVSWVLGFVRSVAEHPECDPPDNEERASAVRVDSMEVKEGKYAGGEEARGLLYALALRRAFGGMKEVLYGGEMGSFASNSSRSSVTVATLQSPLRPDAYIIHPGDLFMLTNALTTWHHRFLSTPYYPPPLLIPPRIDPIDPATLLPLQPEEWELVAVDKHCTNILDIIMDRCEHVRKAEWSKEEVAGMMWRFGGGLNVRSECTNEEDEQERRKRADWDRTWAEEVRALAGGMLERKM